MFARQDAQQVSQAGPPRVQAQKDAGPAALPPAPHDLDAAPLPARASAALAVPLLSHWAEDGSSAVQKKPDAQAAGEQGAPEGQSGFDSAVSSFSPTDSAEDVQTKLDQLNMYMYYGAVYYPDAMAEPGTSQWLNGWLAAIEAQHLAGFQPGGGLKAPPKSIRESQNLLAGFAVQGAQREWLYRWNRIHGLRALMAAWTPPAPGTAPIEGARAAAVSAALSMVGRIEAHTQSGEKENGIPLRKGAHWLLHVYDGVGRTAEVGGRARVLDVRVPTSNAGIGSWCGVFALWAAKAGGLASGNWSSRDWAGHEQKQGPAKWNQVGPKELPKPGDIAVLSANNHHGMVISASGSDVTTVEGNVGAQSGVFVRTRSRAEWNWGIRRAMPRTS